MSVTIGGQSKSFPTGLNIGVDNSGVFTPILFNDSQGGTGTKFSFGVGGSSFNGVFDSVTYWGWNYSNNGTKIDSSKAAFGFGLEFDFFNGGIHAMEYNFDWFGANYPTDATATVRPMAFFIDKASNTASSNMYWWFRMGNSGSSKFTITNWDGSTDLLTVQTTGNLLLSGNRLTMKGSFPAISTNDSSSTLSFITNSAVRIHIDNARDGLKFGNTDQSLLYRSGSLALTTNCSLAFTPSTAQVLVAATAILANAGVVQISAASPITSTAAPTIANGTDGQMLTIVNTGSNAITLSDQGTLASSNLRLAASTVALGPRQSIQLMYSGTVGDWVQVGNLVAVI